MFGKLNSKNSRKIGALKITPVKIKVPMIYIVLRILLFFEGFEPRNISLKIVAKTPNQAARSIICKKLITQKVGLKDFIVLEKEPIMNGYG